MPATAAHAHEGSKGVGVAAAASMMETLLPTVHFGGLSSSSAGPEGNVGDETDPGVAVGGRA